METSRPKFACDQDYLTNGSKPSIQLTSRQNFTAACMDLWIIDLVGIRKLIQPLPNPILTMQKSFVKSPNSFYYVTNINIHDNDLHEQSLIKFCNPDSPYSIFIFQLSYSYSSLTLSNTPFNQLKRL